MKEFSILFLKNPTATARQYSVSYSAVYAVCFVCLCTVVSLGGLYYFQHQKIIEQQNQLEKQEHARTLLRDEIDAFSEKEERIAYLESYVEELKQIAFDSENSLQSHMTAFKQSLDNLAQLHAYVCSTMKVACATADQYSRENPEDAVAWMGEIHENFTALGQAVKKFSEKKITSEEQESTIKQLQLRIAHMEQQLATNLDIVKSKERSMAALSKRIRKVTGIEFQVDNQFLSQPAKSSQGRGGPSGLTPPDDFENNYLETSYLERYLNQTEGYYESVVRSFENLSRSIERDSQLWKNTPTIIPTKAPVISDSYGKRIDPFTNKWDFHAGVDFVGKTGDPIYAPADGIVKKARRQRGYGRFIEIEHGLGFYKNQQKRVFYTTRYGHLSRIRVKEGQKVKRGELIGLVGSSGRSTGPHLHYELLINGRHTNPLSLISHFTAHQNPIRRKR